ncbi:DUF2784 domain-containing protein [Advenella mimigardefordensis]|uniref:Putative membrane protein n=1 Tax=Advenella mimigardefordensis (strain DSM 17166 / LMG 22922 / DPN7) TaxID=1247726 RepID=W0PG43_ADVMD|nr:DUF2784 domain-containing protein [Advenella mimigardefordensis]AHG65676.1 putative membrane protein [Advenella mimigardefordensis DPN7]
MIYRVLADLVLVLHFAFILFAIFGGLLVLQRLRIIWLHLPALVWGATIVGLGAICPLTPLENTLRTMAGQQAYAGSFLEHYLLMAIYPPGLTREVQVLLAAGLVMLNVIIYFLVWRRYGGQQRGDRKN